MKDYRPLVPVNPEGLDAIAAALLKTAGEEGGENIGNISNELPRNVAISNPEKYLFLPAKKYGKYNYSNTLLSLERFHNGKNWFNTHKALAAEGAYMPTIRQFVDAVKLLKSGKAINGKGQSIDKNIVNATLDDIFKLGNYRGRWLDADFKVIKGKLHINYGHKVVGGKITPQYSDPLVHCLMIDKGPGIALEDWINRATEHGLPPVDVAQGDIWYYRSLEDNNSVARFVAFSDGADLVCNGDPADSVASLGVHVARKIGGVK